MTGDLYINGSDAWSGFRICMGDGFLDEIGKLAPAKSYIENKSRLENGKRVLFNNVLLDSRELTLKFVIIADTQAIFQIRKKMFENILKGGLVTINVPAENTGDIKLKYINCASYARKNNSCIISVKFEEFNPANR